MPPEPPVIFYDIASSHPLRTFAANPWKTRFALNFKRVPYRTQWVQMPDITSVREQLGVPANRTLPDGSPYHTLPVIQDTENDKLLGDSFEIALYLDNAFPESPSLFRPYTTGLTAAFNAQIDGIFTKYAILCSQMPFDAAVADAVRDIFAKRANAMSVAMDLGSERREQLFVSFEADLGELVKAYRHTGASTLWVRGLGLTTWDPRGRLRLIFQDYPSLRHKLTLLPIALGGTTDYFWRKGGTSQEQSQRPGREEGGPFLDGNEPAYSDFIVASWLKMFEAAMPPEDWQRVRSWHSGFFGQLVDALGKWSEIK